MKGAEKRRDKILEKDIANTGKRVFLVEGESDVQAYRELFAKKFGADFDKKWVITGGGKHFVKSYAMCNFFKPQRTQRTHREPRSFCRVRVCALRF